MHDIMLKGLVLHILKTENFPKISLPILLKKLLCISHCEFVISSWKWKLLGQHKNGDKTLGHKKQTLKVTVIKETKLPFLSIYIPVGMIFKLEKLSCNT